MTDAPTEALDEGGEQGPPDYTYALLEGDIVAAKVTLQLDYNGDPNWVTFGVQTRALETETEEDTFNRIATVVNTRVIDLADDIHNRLDELAQAQHTTPIRPNL